MSKFAALASERQAHAATEACLQKARRQLDEGARQLAEVKNDLGAEIDLARQSTDAAEARAVNHEKRALREIDLERTARQKGEKQFDELRIQLATARIELKDAAVQHATATGSLRAELGLAQQPAELALNQQRIAEDELVTTRSSLQEAKLSAERAQAEAETKRRLVRAKSAQRP